MGGMSGEREPKGAQSVDERGERKEGGKERAAKGMSGEREPAGAKASDSSGERRVSVHNGIGMGKKDATGREGDHGKAEGRTGEFNTGHSGDGPHYRHDRHKKGHTYG